MKLKGVPIRGFHGDVEDTVGIEGSRAMVEGIKKAKGKITGMAVPGPTHQMKAKIFSAAKGRNKTQK